MGARARHGTEHVEETVVLLLVGRHLLCSRLVLREFRAVGGCV